MTGEAETEQRGETERGPDPFKHRGWLTVGAAVHLAEDVKPFVAIANGEYYGGGMRIAPGATTDDGLLNVCVVGDISRMTALRQMPNLYRGTHVNHAAVSTHVAADLAIEGVAATHAHLDGEPFGAIPLRVRIAPRALRVAAAGPVQSSR